jgi:DNA-binding XRE family transcriptional regulator
MIEVKIKNKIGEKLEEYQKQYGSSKTFIAKKLGVSKQTLNTICQSENPTIQTIAKMAVALNCPMEDLYEVEMYEDGMVVSIEKYKYTVNLK